MNNDENSCDVSDVCESICESLDVILSSLEDLKKIEDSFPDFYFYNWEENGELKC